MYGYNVLGEEPVESGVVLLEPEEVVDDTVVTVLLFGLEVVDVTVDALVVVLVVVVVVVVVLGLGWGTIPVLL